ncbi:MAG: hypothetical protein NC548_22815 [Lachnospiraceae bacterium]|nr:hypothetical protein [Lachnospiraceae bacterium]
MTRLMEISCDFLKELYGFEYQEYGDTLFVFKGETNFKLGLMDRERFGIYTLYHQDHIKGTSNWHVQLKSKSIFKILFNAFAHDFHKENELYIEREDVDRLKEDIYKVYNAERR